MGYETEHLKRDGLPKSAAAVASAPTGAPVASAGLASAFSGALGNLFSGFLTQGGLDFTKKIGKTIYDIFKGFAEGTIKIEPLDIYTAITDLLKSFFNAMFECVVKPAANAAGIVDTAPKRKAPSAKPFSDASKMFGEVPGDRKRSVEKASTPKASRGLGFSPASRDAGLHGHADRSRPSLRSLAEGDHDELYDASLSTPRERVGRSFS